MSKIRARLTYANVMSTIAVFVALGGATAFAASKLSPNSVGPRQLQKNAVTGAKVKNGSLTGADIDVGTLNGVPSAKRAGSAARADSAAHADSADTATTATNFPAPEAMHVVGLPGEPQFIAGWENAVPSEERAAFFIDREGVVHLQGRVHRATGGSLVVFTLPASYAPAETQTFPAVADSGLVRIVVTADGGVGAADFTETDDIFMNGISWRAGH